jgi:hypothetical protein
VEGSPEAEGESLGQTKKVGQGQRRWRHEMELPRSGKDVRKLWVFVAAHVEDSRQGKPCPLAVKAWKQVPRDMRTEYKERTAAGLLPTSLPERMPERTYSISPVAWSSK